MRNPYVLVVIPFKNEVNLLIDLAKSIFDSYVCGFSYSMFFWDDGSDNSQLDILYNNVPKTCPIIKNENIGYTNTVYNIFECGKKLTDFDHLLLLNSDTKFEKNTFYSLVSRSLSNPNIAVVGGKIIKYNGDEIIHTGTRIENNEIVDPYVGFNRFDSRTNFFERRLWVNGACALYKLNILRNENLNFDLNFKPAYFEEADLMTKMNVMGYCVAYEPKAVVHHVMNATHGKERNKYHEIFWNNWNKYNKKWKKYFSSEKLQF